MNSAERKTNKKIQETVTRRSAQGWTADQIGARIWHCYGHLYSVKGNVLRVKMAGGDQSFEIPNTSTKPDLPFSGGPGSDKSWFPGIDPYPGAEVR